MVLKKEYKYILLSNPEGAKGKVIIEELVRNNFFNKKNLLVVTTSKGAISQKAAENNICYLLVEPHNLSEDLKDFKFDFLISCGWNHKISMDMINMARINSINCHSSYLPDYKGASAYKHAWANKESYSGSTVHLLTSKFDGGNIIAQFKIKIYFWDTPKSLLERIARVTTILLPYAILRIEGGYSGESQQNKVGRYFYKTSNAKFLRVRIINIILSLFRLSLTTTKYKEL